LLISIGSDGLAVGFVAEPKGAEFKQGTPLVPGGRAGTESLLGLAKLDLLGVQEMALAGGFLSDEAA